MASKNENLITNRTNTITNESKKVTVVGGKTIVTEMLNEGFVMNEIEDIRIGYSWTISSESVQIVEFTPTWYIKRMERKTLAELKAEKHQTEPVNGPQATGGDADGF